MRKVKENFFDSFKCLAGKCPCTCCSGWQIVIDEETLDKYDSLGGSTGELLNQSVDWLEGTFMQKPNKDCAFLNSDGLCDLIKAEGDEILCNTCRLYPRHVEEYEDLREWSLSLSCPEAVSMLTKLDGYLDFEITDDDEPDPLEEAFEDFDFILFSKLLDSRDLFFEILKNETLTLEDRLSAILEISRLLQESYDSGDYFTMDDIISAGAPDSLTAINIHDFIADNLNAIKDLERLSSDWDNYLSYLDSMPEDISLNNSCFLTDISAKRHELILVNLLISLLYTYFPGSIYTGMIYGVTKMCLFACVFIDALSQSKSISLKRELTLSEFEEIIYRYSRETEHSDLNINALLEHFDL